MWTQRAQRAPRAQGDTEGEPTRHPEELGEARAGGEGPRAGGAAGAERDSRCRAGQRVPN